MGSKTKKANLGLKDLRWERKKLSELQAHPGNYRNHPPDQIEHIAQSIRQHGHYKNIVVSNDMYVLAGNGSFEACKVVGLSDVMVVVLPYKHDSVEALKVVAGDNEVGHLAEVDDRALTEILKYVKENDVLSLVGTGFDDAMLANLVYITRPESEVRDRSAARESGMPAFQPGDEKKIQLILTFRNTAERDSLIKRLGVFVSKKVGEVSCALYPPSKKRDLSSVRFK